MNWLLARSRCVAARPVSEDAGTAVSIAIGSRSFSRLTGGPIRQGKRRVVDLRQTREVGRVRMLAARLRSSMMIRTLRFTSVFLSR